LKQAAFRRMRATRYAHILFFMLFFTCSFLHAQTSDEGGSFVTRTREGFVIAQVITFPAVPNTVRYEVEIEQELGREYIPAEKIETTVNRVEVTLRAGYYRYRVTAFNIMNLWEGRSEWQELEIRPAVKPQVESLKPFYGLYFFPKIKDKIITIYGNYFYPDSEYALVPHKRKWFDWSGIDLETRKDVVFPDDISVTRNSADLTFGRDELKQGSYDIFIRNPGGMWSVFDRVKVGSQNSSNFIFSGGYSPMLATFDYKNDYELENYGVDSTEVSRIKFFNANGFYVHFGWIFFQSKIGNFGVDLQVYGHKNIFDEPFETFLAGLLYQWETSPRWQHNIRFGAGYGPLHHRKFIIDDQGYDQFLYNQSDTVLYLGLGYNVQFFIWKNMFFEAGMDFQYAFASMAQPDDYYLAGATIDPPNNHLVLRPTIGIGWQFGRWVEYAEVVEAAARGEDYSMPIDGKKRSEWFWSVNWTPLIPIGFDRYSLVESGYYGPIADISPPQSSEILRVFNFAGFGSSIGYYPLRWNRNKLGFGFDVSFLSHANMPKDFPGILGEIIFYSQYQRVLNENLYLNGKFGIGIINDYIVYENYYYQYEEEIFILDNSHSNVAFAYKIGISMQYFFWRNMYAEASLDFSFTQYEDKEKDNQYFLRPGIKVGFQFNRNAESGLRIPGTGLPRLRSATAPAAVVPAENE